MSEVTILLDAVRSGDPDAQEKLWAVVYEDLRKLAASKMAQEKPGQTLQATALVHEVWLRLGGKEELLRNSSHFFATAATAMRRILVDIARKKARAYAMAAARSRLALRILMWPALKRHRRRFWPWTKC